MLVAIVRIPAPPDPAAAAAMEQRFAERLSAVASAPGFLGFELLRPAEGGHEYLSVSRWASRADFDAWANGAGNAQAHGRPAGAPRPTGGASFTRWPASRGQAITGSTKGRGNRAPFAWARPGAAATQTPRRGLAARRATEPRPGNKQGERQRGERRQIPPGRPVRGMPAAAPPRAATPGSRLSRTASARGRPPR